MLSASDIVEITQAASADNLTDRERILYSALGSGPKHINEMVQLTSWDTAQVSSELTLMEIKGKVRCVGNGTFAIIK
ncbi:TPA: hypothetical protein DHW58_02045 [Patescibacteria group bacterium]|nr:hypothetical protein [Patescibacteria group bacterium]